MFFTIFFIWICVVAAVIGWQIAKKQRAVAKSVPCPNCKAHGNTVPSKQRALGIAGGATKTMYCRGCGYRW